MGLFLYLNLLTERELRLACWETAAGRKAKNFSASAKGPTKTKGFVGSRGSLMTYALSASVWAASLAVVWVAMVGLI